jgi:hypothetical protein
MKPTDKEYMRPISCYDGLDDYTENPGWYLMLRHDEWDGQVPPNMWFRITGTEGEWNSGDLWLDASWVHFEWTAVAFTFDEDTDTLSGYINGELAGVTVVPEGRSVASETNSLIMGHGGGAEEYQGLLDEVYVSDVVLTDAQIWKQVNPNMIPVPNGSFEEIYKPGSTTITADIGGGWTNGVGPNTPMNGDQIATYSDETTGNAVDIPGWINVPDWPPSYDWPVGCGSVAKQTTPPDGDHYYTANGSNWGNSQGGAIESDAPLARIESGLAYTVAMLANGPVTPVVLELLADGEPLTPSSSVDPNAPYEWEEFSRTYDTASLADHVGKSLTIRVGFGPDAVGTQSHIDAVSLSFVAEEPEPSVSLIEDFDSLAVGSSMHDVEGWQGWKGDPDVAALVTDAVAYSGTNSLEIVGGRDDLEALWPVVDTGTYDLTVMQYVPATTGGAVWYWAYGLGTIVVNCDTEKVYVNDLDAATRVEADLLRDQWVEMKIAIDLDVGTCDFYYGEVLLGSRECAESNGVDIWPDGNVDVVYYDDFSFAPAQ